MALTHDDVATTRAPTTASLLRWSSVLGGVVIGAALLILLTTLWTALAVGTEVQAVADGIGWYLAASAVVALFVGGLLAGALSGVPGIGPGTFNGLAVWGVILILSAAIGVPGALNAFATPGMEVPALEGLQAEQAIWPAFWSLLIGAVTAALGGALGGMMTRGAPAPVRREVVEQRRGAYAADERDYRDRRQDDRPYRDRDDRPDRDRDRDYRDPDYRDRTERMDADRERDPRSYDDERDRPRHVAGQPAPGARRDAEPTGRERTDRDRDYPPAP